MTQNEKKIRTFKYSIPNLSISQVNISIDLHECRTIYDLRKKISSNLNLSEDQLYFKNIPNKKLRNIDENYDFELIYRSSHPDIDFLLPGGKKVKIKDCYNMKFREIFPIFEKGGYYYSPKLINSQSQLFLNKKEISIEGHPFLTSEKDPLFVLRFKEKPVILPYGQTLFTVPENEKLSEITNLIQKAYPNLNVSVFDSNGKKPEKIKSCEKYKIRVEKIVKFTNIDKLNESQFLHVDFYESVLSIKRLLVKKLNSSFDNLIICDIDKNRIPNSKRPLRNFQKLDSDFFYKILTDFQYQSFFKKRKVIHQSSSDVSISSTNYYSDYYSISYGEYDYDDDYDSNDEFFRNSKKTFFYSVDDLFENEKIRVNTDECKTIFDLKKKIAYEINVPNDILQFKKKLPKDLKRIFPYITIGLRINCSCPDIIINIPEGKRIKIKDGYKMIFDEIFEYVENAGLYCSEKCIENDIHLFKNNIEIPIKGFPFLTSDKNTIFELKLTGKLVFLKYKNCKFILQNNEDRFEAEYLLENAFPDKRLTIVNSDGSDVSCLKYNRKYRIRNEKKIKFVDINDHDTYIFLFIDYNDTCNDLANFLVDEFECDYNGIQSNDFIIFDSNRNKISDYNKPIGSIQSFGNKFYFKIINKDKFFSSDSDPKKRYRDVTIFNTISSLPKKHEVPSPNKHEDPSPKKHEMNQRKRDATPQKRKPERDKYDDLFSLKGNQDRSIKVTFVFLETNKVKFYPMNEFISYNQTFKEIAKMISQKLHINDTIILKSKNKSQLKPDLKIGQMKDNIMETIKGKIQYIIYVEIQPKVEDKIEINIGSNDDDKKPPKKKKIEKEAQTLFNSQDDASDSDLDHNEYHKKPLKIIQKEKNEKNFAPKNKKPVNDQIRKQKIDIYNTSRNKELNILKAPQKKRPSSVTRLRPKITPLELTQNVNFYNFQYKNSEKKLLIEDDSTLLMQESKIKDIFDIPEDDQLLFNFVNVDGKSEKILKIENKKMFLFKNGTIVVRVNSEFEILILDIDQIRDLKEIKEIKNDQSGRFLEVQSKKNPEKIYVHKIMKNVDFKNMKKFMKDHETLRKLDHPNILKTYGIFITGDEKTPPSILLEHYSCNLEQLVKNEKKKKLSPCNIFKIIYHIAEGMRYVHFNHIIHRNLNPLNIFISDEGKTKIGEFGISELISLEKQLTLSNSGVLGNIKFIAPELINNDNGYDEKVDVFSFGVLIIYIINEGNLPKIGNELKIPSNFTKFSSDLVKRCISKNSKNRPSFEKIRDELEKRYNEIVEMSKEDDDKIKAFINNYKAKIPKY